MKLDDLKDVKTGFYEGVKASQDISELVFDYFCEKVGAKYRYRDKDVEKGEIPEFFSDLRNMEGYSKSYKASKGLGFATGFPLLKIMVPISLLGKGWKYCKGYRKKGSDKCDAKDKYSGNNKYDNHGK